MPTWTCAGRWIINPIAAKDFLKKYLVTAPANKILTFGGDYRYVEQVLGHAVIARQGIALALSELVEEGWLSLDDALELVDPIMHGNARRIFALAKKTKALESAPWLRNSSATRARLERNSARLERDCREGRSGEARVRHAVPADGSRAASGSHGLILLCRYAI